VTSPAASRLSSAATSGSSVLPANTGAESVTRPLFQHGDAVIDRFPASGGFPGWRVGASLSIPGYDGRS
jgi:hypothetical protein